MNVKAKIIIFTREHGILHDAGRMEREQNV